jgi:glucose-6-phosphate dehydrogenase assembly protein OpcA
MIIDLTDTTASKINAAIIDARRRAGSPSMGMVLTLIIDTDETGHHDALKAATEAAREHPSRILVVVARPTAQRQVRRREEPRLDAEVHTGGEAGPGEVVLMRLHGALSGHAESVVLPLLLPDAPVVTWWPGAAPEVPAESPLGVLSQRRVTDSAAASRPLAELAKRAASYRPGDTDLAWTRLTTWRTLLAVTLDEPFDPITSVEVASERGSPSAELLAAWLGQRLDVPVERKQSRGPGITAVRLHSKTGEIAVTRPDGRLAMLSRSGWPDRPVALRRRQMAELIAEELRRLDPDDVYGATLARLGGAGDAGSSATKGNGSASSAAASSPAESSTEVSSKKSAPKPRDASSSRAAKRSASSP